MSALLANLEMTHLKTFSKPPRLLEFSNKSEHQSGIKGIIWRVLDAIDRLSDQRAWVQMTFRKQDQTGHKVELP
jgi:hypothetical protein